MAENIEIKAKAAAWDEQLARAMALADSTLRLRQKDVFFNCANGRLKLRSQYGKGSYLVFYRRPGLKGPKTSTYSIVPVRAPAALLRKFRRLLGTAGIVEKERIVCFAGRTRIHFDKVRGLGRFIELEVVLAPGEDPAAGRREAARLMTALGIHRSHLLSEAYTDLLRARR